MAILVTTQRPNHINACRYLVVTASAIVSLAITRNAVAQADFEAADAPRRAISIAVGADVSHDSNLFRQPSSAQLTSDTITTAYVGLRLDKQVSLQRFQLDVTETMNNYAKTSYLNFNALDYRGAWLWQLGSRVSGTLSADRRESLVPFEDILNPGNFTRNIRIIETQTFSMDVRALGDWHLLMGVNQSTQTSELAVEIQPDYKAVGHEAGIKYAAPTGSSVTALLRSTTGDYINQSSSPVLGTGYQQDESEIKFSWMASGKSTLNGRLTWLDRTQDGAPQRDFSGVAGEVHYAWAVTEQLVLNFKAKRDLVPFQDTSGSYIVDDSISIDPTWKVTDKTTVHLLALHGNSSFEGFANIPAPQRTDKLNLLELGARWAAANRLVLGASLLMQSRDSTIAAYAFKNYIARVTASYLF